MSSKKEKTAVQLLVYLSKINDKFFIGVDGNQIDLKDMGINEEKFQLIINAIIKEIKSILDK